MIKIVREENGQIIHSETITDEELIGLIRGMRLGAPKTRDPYVHLALRRLGDLDKGIFQYQVEERLLHISRQGDSVKMECQKSFLQQLIEWFREDDERIPQQRRIR